MELDTADVCDHGRETTGPVALDGAPIRVLIVDDSVVIRRLLSTIVGEDPELEVAGVAANGQIALQRLAQLEPDVVILDLDMPDPDGLQILQLVRAEYPDMPVVMVGAASDRDAQAATRALELGASAVVTKPASVGSVAAAMERVRDELLPKVKRLCRGAARPAALAEHAAVAVEPA